MRKSLRKAEIRDLNSQISYLGMEISKRSKVEVLDDRTVFVDEEPRFFYAENKTSPTLRLLLETPEILKEVVVDMGAVKYVTNGADIMRPGIVEISPGIARGDIVAVVDERNKKPLAVGEALFDAEKMSNMDSGKVIKNLHYVGDEIWKIE